MVEFRDQLTQFFDAYAARFNGALGAEQAEDIDAVVSSFAAYFVESSPAGVMGGQNGEEFRRMIPQGYARYRAIGTRSMSIDQLELSQLNELHWMARVGWDSRYIKPDGAEVRIDFEVIYLLTLQSGAPQIFAYITGDEQKVLAEHGLGN
jgi:hypothetical protein